MPTVKILSPSVTIGVLQAIAIGKYETKPRSENSPIKKLGRFRLFAADVRISKPPTVGQQVMVTKAVDGAIDQARA